MNIYWVIFNCFYYKVNVKHINGLNPGKLSIFELIISLKQTKHKSTNWLTRKYFIIFHTQHTLYLAHFLLIYTIHIIVHLHHLIELYNRGPSPKNLPQRHYRKLCLLKRGGQSTITLALVLLPLISTNLIGNIRQLSNHCNCA